MKEIGHLVKQDVIWWTDVRHNLYTDYREYTFGVELDLLNGGKKYYFYKKEDPNDITYLGDNVYFAIDKFNEVE